MRILFLGNNWVGWQVARWLQENGEQIVGAVVHPPVRERHAAEIVRSADLEAARVFDGSRLRSVEVMKAIGALRPELGVAVFFGYVLSQAFLDLLPLGCVNLHPALLPYNRGAYPNVWSIVEGTPAGVTLHYLDAGVDTGDIIAQRELPSAPTDTGETLYRKLEHASIALFQDRWPLIRSGQAPRIPQTPGSGTSHRTRDVDAIDEIHLDRTYPARKLIDLLRARTFPPHPGAYFRNDGRKIYLRLHLEEEPLTDHDRHD